MTIKITPVVSVVMPCFNNANLLPDVITSILDQNYTDLELLIIDDCSTDNTEDVVLDFQKHDGRIHLIKNSENKGTGYSRQAGILQAKGEYIALADSDDIWMPGKLSTQIEILERFTKIDILFGDFWNIDHVEGKEGRGFDQNRSGISILQVKPIQDHLWFVENGLEIGILKADFIAVPTTLIRAAMINKLGGFDEDLRGSADHEFFFRAATLKANFAYLDYPLIHRHRYLTSNTGNIIVSSERVIKALNKCRFLCTSISREDLIIHVDDELRRTYMYLVYGYGKLNKPQNVWKYYRKASQLKFSIREFVLFLLSMGGSKAFSLIHFLQGRK